ncbi:hypothetical protein [Listeria costaricensis]|uniref:hypothetical protein n=1 Tax=Listeria costaricensis TaxID=2026604 RepID=UPI000C07ED87|nr:hypothetical protein [Listeria costaricensis]
MSKMKYTPIKKNQLINSISTLKALSHSIQDWQQIMQEFNDLSITQRKDICQEQKRREELLKKRIPNTDKKMYLTCLMVDLNIIASTYDVDPTTVCMCVRFRLNEKLVLK